MRTETGRDHPEPNIWYAALMVAIVTAAWAGFCAWNESLTRTYGLDVDGWGHMIGRFERSGRHLSLLFQDPSMWKGPIVPFLFGLSYYLAPFRSAVLVFNIIAMAAAAALFVVTFYRLGATRLAALLAVLCWVFYLPHRYIYGYYFAEPTLSLFIALFLMCCGWAIRTKNLTLVFATGALAGVMLLARPPFLVIAGTVPLLLWYHLREHAARAIALFGLGFLLAYAPWPIRNYATYHEFIPFTTEGPKDVFLSTYLPGDDGLMDTFYAIAEYRALEAGEAGLSHLERYHYWRPLVLDNIRKDPIGQLQLCVRKAMRFWIDLPVYSWIPGWKTTAVAAIFLPLAVLGGVAGWRSLLTQICVLFAGSLWLFHAIVHSGLRYNFPVLPLVFMLSAMGAQAVAGACASRRRSVPASSAA